MICKKKKLNNTSRPSFKHRGRIQAQGEKKFEASEAWAQNEPPTINKGIEMIEKLKNRILPYQARIRKTAFNELKQFITRASKNGGIFAPFSRSFDVKNTDEERVDLEVKKGQAFINDKK